MKSKSGHSESEDTPRRHTAESVARVITSNIESQTAEEVLAILKAHEGQMITTRLLDKLPGGRVDWRLSRQLGWTEIKNRAYINSAGANREGICLMLARSEASVPLSAEFVERENPAYFKGRRERNAQRAESLKNAALLEQVARIFNDIEERRAAYLIPVNAWRELVEAGATSLTPDKYALERECRLRDEKER